MVVRSPFWGLDRFEQSHPVEIVENGSTVLLSPTTISSYGQVVTFADTLTLAQGDTLDFIVNTGPSTFAYLSTGFDATIQAGSVIPPFPPPPQLPYQVSQSLHRCSWASCRPWGSAWARGSDTNTIRPATGP